jgi:DNA-binding transcriptional LysR family regulator
VNWDDVRVFLAVARAGQFVAAARSLKVDHATVARRVTALERALNTRLVDRRTTGVLLTGAGTRFLASAEQMETSFLQAQSDLTDQDVELSGTVRVGAPDGLAAYYLANRFAEFTERHRAITIQLVPVPQVGPLSRREVDIAVVLEKPEAGRFVARKLTDYAIGLFASADYLNRHPKPQRREDLSGHTIVGYVEEFNYSPALDYVGELCGSVPIRFQCASAVGQLEAVRAGVGIGAIHDFIARRHPDLIRLLPESGAMRTYWLVEHEDTRGIGRIRAVHDFLVEAVEKDRASFLRRR